MEIKKVNGNYSDFLFLCRQLEKFQFDLLPILKEKDYSLTDDLDKIEGFVLYLDEKPIGSIGLKHVSQTVCEIVRVFVCENYRRKGYAKILFKKIEDLAREMGYNKAEMVAWAKAQSAIALYKKLGYIQSQEKMSEWYGGEYYIEMFKVL